MHHVSYITRLACGPSHRLLSLPSRHAVTDATLPNTCWTDRDISRHGANGPTKRFSSNAAASSHTHRPSNPGVKAPKQKPLAHRLNPPYSRQPDFREPHLRPMPLATPAHLRLCARDRVHPLHAQAFEALESMALRPFLWYVTTGKAISAKSVVRNWVGRRTRSAMVESLKARGWDAEGRAIGPRGDDGGVAGAGVMQLKGQVQLHPDARAITMTWEELLDKVGRVVDLLVARQKEWASRTPNQSAIRPKLRDSSSNRLENGREKSGLGGADASGTWRRSEADHARMSRRPDYPNKRNPDERSIFSDADVTSTRARTNRFRDGGTRRDGSQAREQPNPFAE